MSQVEGETLQFLAALAVTVFALPIAFLLVTDRPIRRGFITVSSLVLTRHVLEIFDEFDIALVRDNKVALNLIEHTISIGAFLTLLFFSIRRLAEVLRELQIETKNVRREIEERERAVAEKEQADRELEVLARATAEAFGPDVFVQLARAISQTMGIRATVVTECVGTHLHVRAIWDGAEATGIGDYESAGSPCGQILADGRLYIGNEAARECDGLRELFPRFDVQSLCGVALGGRDAPIGTLVLVHDAPLDVDMTEHPAVPIVAARAATEIRHQRDIAERRDLEANLLETQRLESLGSTR